MSNSLTPKTNPLAGIYIHIPFCKKKCTYCDFHFSTQFSSMQKMVKSIAKELILKSEIAKEQIESIYFGGGTPSVLGFDQLEFLFKTIFQNYQVLDKAEITLETNPDDMTEFFVESIKNTPINRWSVGIQSFSETDLRFLGRAHDAKQAKNALDVLSKKGFENFSLDLIYGIPTSSLDDLEKNLETAAGYNPKHISAYSLTIEENTALNHQLKNKKFKEKTEELFEEEYILLCRFLENQNFNHYEVSNFCKTNYEAKHNTAYWERKSYYGFGPSAHSFDGKITRSWNVSNNVFYIKSLENNSFSPESEVLNKKDVYNEIIMTGLRTKKGFDLNQIKENCGEELYKDLLDKAKKIDSLILENEFLKIHEKNWLTSDSIVRKLFLNN